MRWCTRDRASSTPEAQADIKAFNAKLYGTMLGELDAMARKAADEGKPYLAGEHFGPLDAYALTLLRWGGFAGYDPQGFASAWALVQRIAATPGGGPGDRARAVAAERLQAARAVAASASSPNVPVRHHLHLSPGPPVRRLGPQLGLPFGESLAHGRNLGRHLLDVVRHP